MCTHEMLKSGVTVLFYIYAPEVCLCERKILYPDELVQIEISAERMRTAFPVSILVRWREKELQIGEMTLPDGGYQILKTKAGEEILLVVKAENTYSLQCGKFLFPKERVIAIGTDFRNEIFYEYSAFLKDRQILMYRKEENYVLECRAERDDRRTEGLYVNGRTAGEKVLLEKGDKVEILGLRIWILPEILICTSAYGTLWTAERKDEIQVQRPVERSAKETAFGICQRTLQEGKIHEEEVELELPEAVRKETVQPLFLTIGPSFTMMIPAFLMMILGNVVSGQNGSNLYGMTVVMTAASAFLTVFWSMMNRSYRRKMEKKENAGKEREYLAYLRKTEEYLQDCDKNSRSILLQKYPSIEQIIGREEGCIFWNAGKGKREDKFVRMGLGDIEFPIKIKLPGKSRALNRNRLLEEACKAADRYQRLTSVPIGIFLNEENSTGFVGNNIYPVFLQMVVQLAAYYSQSELKLVYFYRENNQKEREIAECLKWMPQIWQEGKKRRFLMGNEREAGEILPYLMERLRNRTEGSEEKEDFYLFLIADAELVKSEQIYSFFTKVQKAGAYHVVFISQRQEQIPGSVRQLVIQESKREEILIYTKGSWERQKVTLEQCTVKQADRYMRSLAGTWEDSAAKENGLPEKVSFLDLYFCHCVEELHCLTRWKENEAAERIRVPIGMGNGNRLIYLDVHEKFHGPHGLIAGTTGSGKSELLQTYLLSLAVSFGPEAVNFFIIDYKGGGMGQVLCELPHCAGVISNLSGRQIKRALLSIKSENTRRQKLLSLAEVSHVDEYAALYREGKVKEPMPHLILVVDEFAELKKEEPAFMQEIISMAQIGRSLGVHLLLATQKPAGTIDDKVWSNTRFRLCLRVADRQDSMDMLHRPEAAHLTGAGRCYMQIGNNEIFDLLQTGYSKEAYEEEKKQEKAVLISATGKRYTKVAEKKYGQCSQLEKTVEYINQSAIKAGYTKAKKLWMQELPEKLKLAEIVDQNTHGFKFCLGMYDDPYRQKQGPLFYDPVEDGHLCLCGMPSTGKSTFLQTLLWQLCREQAPSQMQFLLAASEYAGLTCFKNMPHCMGAMKSLRDAECFFYQVEQLMQQRKELLGGISFSQFQKKQEKGIAPILFVIDNYGTFRELTEDRYQAVLERLAREGLQYGIYLVITALGTGSGEIPGKLFEKMKHTLTLEMSDKVQYGDVLRQYQIPLTLPQNIKGRGLCKLEERILEFQVSLFSELDDYERITQIEHLARELWKQQKAEEGQGDLQKFVMIPDEPDYESMLQTWQTTQRLAGVIPLGYQTKRGYIQGISLCEHFPFLISGEARTGKKNAMHCLLKGLDFEEAEVTIFDRRRNLGSATWQKAGTVLTDEQSFFEWFKAWVKKEKDSPNCLAVYDLADFVQMLLRKEYLTAEMVRELEEIVKKKELLLLAICQSARETEFLGTFWYELFLRKQCGIHLGGNAAGQRLLSFDDMGYAQLGKREDVGVAYLKLGSGTTTQKVLIPKTGKEEKDDISRCTGTGT